MRLVRELLAADADPALAHADEAGRARRYLEVASSGLAVRAGALLVREAGGGFHVTASTLPAAAETLLSDPAGRCGQLARRAAEERRAFVARRSADDPLLRALRDADPAVDTIAVLPLAGRGSVGVLVLAGDDATLATEVVRTLNPALRVLGLLLAPQPGAPRADPAIAQRLEALQVERDAQVQTIRSLEAQIADLEAALATAHAGSRAHPTPAEVAAAASETARAAGALAAATGGAVRVETGTIVVLDAWREWEGYAVRDHRIVVAPPTSVSVAQVKAEPPTRIIVNVAAPGGLASLVGLRADGVTVPVIGVAGHGGERVVGLGVIDAVGHPTTAEALVAAVERAAPRGARVFAAGRDAEALMKMRQALAKHGLSVSLARDTKQIDELLAMVRPQVVVVDLELPMRQGYELVMRMAATTPIPAMVLILPAGDPSPVMVEKVRDRLAAGLGMGAKQWIADMALQKLPATSAAKATTAPATL